MIGIGYELGSVHETGFGLRPGLMTFEGRERFWSDLRQLATRGEIGALVLHRMLGEPYRHDKMDFDVRSQIEDSGDPELTDYAKHMIRECTRFCTDFPAIKKYIYIGSLLHPRMSGLIVSSAPGEGWTTWQEKAWYEVSWVIDIMREDPNTHLVFDEASKFEPDSAAWWFVSTIARWFTGQVLIESLPFPGTPQAKLPGFVLQDNYENLERTQAERAAHTPTVRMTHGDPAEGVVAFVRDCLDKGHTPIVGDIQLNRIKMTLSQVLAEAQAGRPVGTDE